MRRHLAGEVFGSEGGRTGLGATAADLSKMFLLVMFILLLRLPSEEVVVL